jgi:diguanylate cyclase (GGDEF)-like protein/PAS domain S-box-containing protein
MKARIPRDYMNTPSDAEAHQHRIIENACDLILTISVNGLCTSLNPAFETVTGWSSDEWLGKPFAKLIHPDDWRIAREAYQRLLDGQPIHRCELRLVCKHGDTRLIEWVATPQTQAGQVVGLLCLGHDVTERKCAEETLRQQNEYLAALHMTTLGLINRLKLNDLLEEIVVRACALARTAHGYLYVVEPNGSEAVARIARGNFVSYLGQRRRYGQGLAGRAWSTGKTIVIEDYQTWLEAVAGHEWCRAVICIPLYLRPEVVGIFGLAYAEAHRKFDPELIALLEQFGELASLAIENARLFEETQRLATTDELTRVHNRRHFFTLGESELKRARRYGHPLAAIMLDVDHFKKVNDTYGHAIGDEVLCAVATRCHVTVRDVDVLGRYGGEEFAVLLPQAELTAAHRAAERLRQCVAETPIDTTCGALNLTLSLGVACLSDDTPDLIALLNRADAALYRAKAEGRNRIATSV